MDDVGNFGMCRAVEFEMKQSVGRCEGMFQCMGLLER